MSAFDEFDVCRNILESLLTGVCVIDLQKRIVFWSHGAERITGRLHHDVIGRSCVEEALLHCRQSGCEFCSEECPIGRAMKMGRAVEGSGFLHHKSGYEVPVRIRALPVHNQRGSIIGAVETFDELEQSDLQPREKPLAGCLDEVTGVASRAPMKTHLQDALAAFTDRGVPFTVLRFRVEGLGRFRAAFGPDAASSLLRVMARSLASELWQTDILGRWADDEFLAILNGCNRESLPGVRERLRRILTNDAIEWWGERRSLRVSIADAAARAEDTIESILDRTQKCLDNLSGCNDTSAARKSESGS
jgi:diguanylate cyclase (GGDEF)-like protein/PAS domain S-box-containing protein